MIRPLLAYKRPKGMTMDQFLGNIQWPQLATPKIDFIRCLTLPYTGRVVGHMCNALCRSLKPVPNLFIRDTLETQLPPYVDGELGAGQTFQAGSSAIMTHGGCPVFTYYVFDMHIDTEMRYEGRVNVLESWNAPSFVKKLIPVKLFSLQHLLDYEQEQLNAGVEGVMLRPPNSRYITGYRDNRATAKLPWLIAIKRFNEGEAKVIDIFELMHNTNPQELNLLGQNRRSHHDAGMVSAGILGGFLVEDLETKQQFRVGSGLTDAQRKEYWKQGLTLKDKIIKYKFQKHGTLNKPRLPIFLGFRDVKDMS